MAPTFKQSGVVLFKSSGIVAYGTGCCCHTEPAVPCTNCNASQTPNSLELTITSGDLTDWTCVDCNSFYVGTYILDKVDDADCYYTFCEDDPCNGVDSLTGFAYKTKILAIVSVSGTAQVYIMFQSPGDVACNSLFDGLRNATWTYTGADTFNWDCLSNLDNDLSPGPNDPNVDIPFCYAGPGSVHLRALN